MAINALADVQDINTYIDKFNNYLEGNVTVNGVKGSRSNVLNPDTFYSKQLLDTIRLDQDQFMYYRYAELQPIAGKANKLQLRRWSALQAHTDPLIEGVPPMSDKGSVEVYEIDTHQYGRYMEFTDKVNFKIVDPILAHYSREYSIVAIETLDMLAREALFAIAQQAFAGLAKDFEGLTIPTATADNSKPTLTDLRKIALHLKKQLVKPRSNGKYHVIAGPEFFYDMISDPTVEKYMTINNTTKTMYENSMLVPLFGLEFYETLACPTHGRFTTMVGQTATSALRIVAKNNDGTYSYATLKAGDKLTNGNPVYKKESGYVLDKRTGEQASYIPNQEIWDIDGYNADTTLNSGKKLWHELKVMHVLVLGKDALIRTGIEGQGNAKMYTKALGSAGVLDPIDQRQSIGFKINDVGFGSARLEAVVDYMCIPTMVNVI